MAKKKLTPADMAGIQSQAVEDPAYSSKKLADEYKVSRSTINSVLAGTYQVKKRRDFSEEEVSFIVKNPEGLTQKELGNQFGVSSTHIGNIQAGRSLRGKQKPGDGNVFSWVNNPAF